MSGFWPFQCSAVRLSNNLNQHTVRACVQWNGKRMKNNKKANCFDVHFLLVFSNFPSWMTKV